MANQIPPVARNVAVYVHNGVAEAPKRRRRSPTLAGQLRTIRFRRYVKWALSIGPGETYTALDTTSGAREVSHTYFRVDGLAGVVKYCAILFYVDGELSATASPDMIYSFFVGRRIADISQAGVITWDETNHIYEVWYDFGPTFQESLKITIKNEDTTNAVEVRYGIWVEWWE